MRIATLILFLSISLVLAGCASFTPHPELPTGDQPVAVDVSSEMPGMNDYPIGAYVVPDSQVVVTKPRPISTAEGGFGALGVLSAHSSGKKDSKALLGKHEGALRTLLEGQVKDAIVSRAPHYANTSHWTVDTAQSNGARLLVTPFAYLSADETGRGNVQLFLKAKYFDAAGSKAWSSRYVYRHPETRPVTGPGSWTADDGRLFNEAVAEGYRQVVDVMIQDSARGNAGWSPTPARVKGPFLAATEAFELNGEILEQSADWIVFNAAGGGLVYGINIIPRADFEVLPPQKN